MPTLECLRLSPAQRDKAEEEIRRRAYLKWEEAGCPSGCDQQFWSEAELEWIEFCYVPARDNGLPALCEEEDWHSLGV